MSENRNETNRLDELNERTVAALTPSNDYVIYWAGGLKLQREAAPNGFGIRVSPKGQRTFLVRFRHPKSRKRYMEKIGVWDGDGGSYSVLEAIRKAREIVGGADKEDADSRFLAEQADKAKAEAEAQEKIAAVKRRTVNDLLDLFETKELGKLRTRDNVTNALKRHVRPAIGDVCIYDLRKSTIIDMLDAIESNAGETMAARTLAYVRRAFNWYAATRGDDEFRSPIVKGMYEGGNNARNRVLSDDEIRDVWAALDKVTEPACYARYIRMLLLTATRRSEASEMHTSELQGDNWIIPGERYKRLPKHAGLDHLIPLSAKAKTLIGDKPEGSKNHWFVFSTTGGKVPFSGFSKAKELLDAEINKIRRERGDNDIADWRLHDLRRTARTLMSRAKVDADVAERCLGHIIGGVRGVYDRHEYEDEKRHAFEALAAMIERIIDPQPNVIPMAQSVKKS